MIARTILEEYILIMKAKEFIKYMVDSGVQQTEIARKIGVTPGAITNYLYGKTEPTLETVRKIARAYNISLADLISEIPEDQRSGYSIRDDGKGGFIEVPFCADPHSHYTKPVTFSDCLDMLPLDDDTRYALELVKDLPPEQVKALIALFGKMPPNTQPK